MSEVTVKQLARDVGAPVDRLLKQIVEAGLKARSEDDSVTSDEKQQLLAYLRKTHGEADAEPRKITLKRKTTTTLKAGKAKTVNVEVRKRRTYIKRAELQPEPEPEAPKPEEVIDAQPAPAAAEEATPAVVEAQAPQAADAAQAPEAEAKPEAAPDTTPSESEEAPSDESAPAEPEAAEPETAEGVAVPPPDKDGKDRKGKKKSKVRERTEEVDDGKPKKKQAGHRGPRSRPVEEPVLISDDEDESTPRKSLRVKKKPKEKRHGFERPTKPMVREVEIPETITVGDLAQRMAVKAADVIKTLMGMGVMATINQALDQETAVLVTEELGHKPKTVSEDAFEEEVISRVAAESEGEKSRRAPVVSVMGHVDHGKTSLLDYIRRTKVASGESGGITQHIGAYHVTLPQGGQMTFLDTPGHEAFTAMRARGAQVTDIAIIVVAADDAVMPQTKEAINHAQAAGIPMVIAINKMDRPEANADKIRQELSEMNVLVEEWGGKFQSQEISAKNGTNIEELLEKVLLEAEMLDLKANQGKRAIGTVVESSLDKGRGYVTNLLVEGGTMRIGDAVLAGQFSGKVKAMFNERGARVDEAGPSVPVSILGFDGAPNAGDKFHVFEDEREARNIAVKRQQLQREQGVRSQRSVTLEELGRRIAVGEFKELNLIVKGDVDGSIEALSDSLQKLSTEKVQVNIIHKAVGQVSESDILLASASSAIIIGFQVRPSGAARRLAEKEGIQIKLYSVIYKAIEEMKDAMEGLLSAKIEENVVGSAEIRETFKISKVGTIAGCFVIDGNIKRNNKVRVIREGVVVYTGTLGSLKRFKDDVKEVAKGFECGLNIDRFNDIKVGDVVEAYEEVEVKQTLED